MKNISRRALLATACLLAAAQAQSAENYPTRPMRMIVPFAPGGASDFVARIIQPKMTELLAQQVVVDNRAGAAGNIGIKLVHVPYKGGAGPATTAVLAGEVVATMVTTASVIPHVKTGRMKVLGVIAPSRIPQLPDTPTLAESGFPELKLGSWQAMYVPRDTPRPIVNTLYSVMSKTMADPEVVKRLQAGGAAIVTSKSPEEFAVFLREQTEFWAKIVKDVGAAVEQ